MSEPPGKKNFVFAAIMGLLGSYVTAASLGYPQLGTKLTNAAHDVALHAEPIAAKPQGPADAHAGPKFHPPYFMVLPFGLLLGAIAILPLVHATGHWWEHNLNKFYIAGGLALATLAYYVFAYGHPLDRHFLGHKVVEPAGTPAWNLGWVVIQNAILNDFVPFIILLFSLYTISGGIRITGDLPAHPSTNTAFLLVGAVLASFVGTTGAAMLLIRPVLETNSERKHVAHTVVFFIFIVCNCGGCLLPIGDPPLFLGYLQGVDFLWTLNLWPQWALVNAALLAIYFLWDTLIAYPKEERKDIQRDETRVRGLQFEGLMPNALLLVGIVLAAALLSPTKPFPGTHWYPWLYLREAAQLALVALSLMLGSPRVREENKFNYGAIVEVAALFIGIFICMQPALQILSVQGPSLGIDSTAEYFWFTGALSSVLDNAPTYLVFFETAKTLPEQGVEKMAGVAVNFLAAISLGAVFMGANTYIGNGPNFMVKTIAEKSGIKMPSFFGYMAYSFGVLIPLFVLVTVIFIRR
jgi:Na+/H+ antiporter NhaD/arsenite permease-like protein